MAGDIIFECPFCKQVYYNNARMCNCQAWSNNTHNKLYGRQARGKRETEFPVSRDWAHITCYAIGCKFHRSQENECGIPSLCKINEIGVCVSFKPKETPKQIDGD